jgi:hypothetical protein
MKAHLTVAAAVVTALALGGCGSSPKPAEKLVQGNEAASAFPTSTLQDVVSYASAVVVFTVSSERALPEEELIRRTAEGYVAREVTISVLRTLWRADGSSPLPGSLSFEDWGWTVHDGQRFPATSSPGAARLTVGTTYAAALVHLDCGWGVTSESAVTVAPDLSTLRTATSAPTELAKAFAGSLLTSRLASTLAGISPDPAVAKHASLPADRRYLAVLADRNRGPVPAEATTPRDCA